MVGQQRGWKDIWVVCCSGHPPRMQPCSPYLSWWSFSIDLSTWIPYSQALLSILAPLFLFACKLPQVCLLWSLCHGPPDHTRAPVPSAYLCAQSPGCGESAPLPPLPPQACMLALGSGSPHRHFAPSPLLHRNPRSLCMLTYLTMLTGVPPVPPLAPYCTPVGCFLLADQLQTSSGLGKSPNCLVIQ